jgi:hypothetical protein
VIQDGCNWSLAKIPANYAFALRFALFPSDFQYFAAHRVVLDIFMYL